MPEYKTDKIWLQVRQEPEDGQEAPCAAVPVQELWSNYNQAERELRE